MKKLIGISLFLLWISVIGHGASVVLAWDKSCETDVKDYVVYWSTGNTPVQTNIVAAYTDPCSVYHPATTNVYRGYMTNTIVVAGITNTTAVVSNLVNGTTYNFAVTARNFSGLESDYSMPLSFTVPLRPIKTLRKE